MTPSPKDAIAAAPGSDHEKSGQPKPLRRQLWYPLMINLLYPSVLGSILYSLLQVLFVPELYIFDLGKFVSVLLAVSIVWHFCIDVLYISLLEDYDFSQFVIDFVIVGFLYVAYRAVEPTTPAVEHDLRLFFACMTAIYVIFLPQELYIWNQYRKERDRAQRRVHTRMIVHTVVSIVVYAAFSYYVALVQTWPSVLILVLISLHYGDILREKYELEMRKAA